MFGELPDGNGQAFMDALADDARWTIIGSSAWSRTYEGKQAITDELMRPRCCASSPTGTRLVPSAS